MRHWRWYSKLLFALLVAAFAYFVWPTPWMYFTVAPAGTYGLSEDMRQLAARHASGGEITITLDDPAGAVIRVHRLTGRTQVLEFNKWRDVFVLAPLDK